jgi:hypothetical protein
VRGAEGLHPAPARGQLLHVRQLAFVHPLPDQAWIHPVEAQEHELLLESLRCAARPARDHGPEADDERSDQNAFHKLLGEKKL